MNDSLKISLILVFRISIVLLLLLCNIRQACWSDYLFRLSDQCKTLPNLLLTGNVPIYQKARSTKTDHSIHLHWMLFHISRGNIYFFQMLLKGNNVLLSNWTKMLNYPPHAYIQMTMIQKLHLLYSLHLIARLNILLAPCYRNISES